MGSFVVGLGESCFVELVGSLVVGLVGSLVAGLEASCSREHLHEVVRERTGRVAWNLSFPNCFEVGSDLLVTAVASYSSFGRSFMFMC